MTKVLWLSLVSKILLLKFCYTNFVTNLVGLSNSDSNSDTINSDCSNSDTTNSDGSNSDSSNTDGSKLQ